MPESVVTILVSAGVAFVLALGTLYLSRRAGLTDLDDTLRRQRGELVDTLKTRVEHLEAENKRLTEDVAYLKRENEQLRLEVSQLQARIIKADLERDR